MCIVFIFQLYLYTITQFLEYFKSLLVQSFRIDKLQLSRPTPSIGGRSPIHIWPSVSNVSRIETVTMATNTILINMQCCTVCQTRIHKSNKKIQCVLCFCCAHKSCVDSDSDSYFCANCIHNTLPLASISDSDFLNLTLGQSYLRSKANRTELKLDLLQYDSIENKFIDDECIDADSNHYNYIFGDILPKCHQKYIIMIAIRINIIQLFGVWVIQNDFGLLRHRTTE